MVLDGVQGRDDPDHDVTVAELKLALPLCERSGVRRRERCLIDEVRDDFDLRARQPYSLTRDAATAWLLARTRVATRTDPVRDSVSERRVQPPLARDNARHTGDLCSDY